MCALLLALLSSILLVSYVAGMYTKFRSIDGKCGRLVRATTKATAAATATTARRMGLLVLVAVVVVVVGGFVVGLDGGGGGGVFAEKLAGCDAPSERTRCGSRVRTWVVRSGVRAHGKCD